MMFFCSFVFESGVGVGVGAKTVVFKELHYDCMSHTWDHFGVLRVHEDFLHMYWSDQVGSVPWPIGPCAEARGDMRGDSVCFQSFLWKAIVSKYGVGGDVHSLILSILLWAADHSIAHPPWCREGCLWKGYRAVWHSQTMHFSFFDSCQKRFL